MNLSKAQRKGRTTNAGKDRERDRTTDNKKNSSMPWRQTSKGHGRRTKKEGGSLLQRTEKGRSMFVQVRLGHVVIVFLSARQ